jgi:DNA-directed RNA polymerase subunit RPC12/RpoP
MAEDIAYVCRNCRAIISGPPGLTGKSMDCPSCGERSRVVPLHGCNFSEDDEDESL